MHLLELRINLPVCPVAMRQMEPHFGYLEPVEAAAMLKNRALVAAAARRQLVAAADRAEFDRLKAGHLTLRPDYHPERMVPRQTLRLQLRAHLRGACDSAGQGQRALLPVAALAVPA